MRFVNYKIFASLIFVVILLLFLKNTASNIVQLQQNASVIDRLSDDLSEAKQKNAYLIERLKFVQTDQFIEEEAREKLGYVQGNEILIQDSNTNEEQTTSETLSPKPNWEQWIELFF